jgi:NRPS condensation-like uncharacterized protein
MWQPTSWAQQQLWLAAQFDEAAGRAYHIGWAVHLSGALDPVALRSALDAIVGRHEVLRARFRRERGTVLQTVAPPEPFRLRVDDLSGHAATQREQAVRQLLAGEQNEPFDLKNGSPLRGRLLRTGEGEHIFVVTMHHLVSDGWSMGIFVRELALLYEAYREGRTAVLPPLRIQYPEHARQERERLTGDALKDQLEYWYEQLRFAPPLLELPTDHPRPQIQSYRGATIAFTLGRELSDALKGLGRRHGVTPYMVLFTSFAILLSRLSGQDQVVIGVPVANRHTLDTEHLIGLFMNTLALRVDLRDEPSVAEVLQRVKRMMLGAWRHQEVSFDQVVQLLRPDRRPAYSPVFQTLFVLQNTPQGELQLPGLRLTPLETAEQTAQLDLSLKMVEAPSEIVGTLNYATDLFDASTIELWIGYLSRVLKAMVLNAQVRVGELSLSQGDN